MGFKISFSPQIYVIFLISISLFLAATNIQGGWLYIIDSLLVSLLIFSFVTPVNQTGRIKISRLFAKSVYEDNKTEIEINVENKSKKMVSFIEIMDFQVERKSEKPVILKGENRDNFFIELSPGESKSFKYEITPELRGVYNFEKFIITSFGPFGLVKFSRRIKVHDEILVYPNLPIISQFFFSGLKGIGYKLSALTKNDFEASLPYNARDYRRGDSRKLIHWKTTARLNKLMVKELESEQSLNVQILFDLEKGNFAGNGKESNLEYLLKFAGGIFKHCIDNGYKVEFLYYEKNKVEKLTEVTPWKQVLDTFAYLDTNSKQKARNLIKEKEVDFKSLIIPFFLKPDDKDIAVLSEFYRDNYSVVPVFAEINSFDKNYFPVKSIIEKCPFKNLVIKQGDNFNLKIPV